MSPEKLAQLREPFPQEQVGLLPKVTCKDCTNPKVQCGSHQRRKCRTCKAYISTEHIHIDFVGHAHVTERLLNIDTEWNWEPMGIDSDGLPRFNDKGGLWIRLTVAGVTRIGYGDGAGPEAVKIAISDAIKNAAMRFGVALDLWKKEPPDPVADVPERQVERPRQTPVDRAAELRGQIAAIGKAKGQSINEMQDEFSLWSKGEDISKASVAVLAEYKAHLDRGAS